MVGLISIVNKVSLDVLKTDDSKNGKQAYNNKNYSLAKKQFYLAYKYDKGNLNNLRYAAEASFLDKDYTKALSYFLELKEKDYSGKSFTEGVTSMQDIVIKIAFCYVELEKKAEAIKVLNQELLLDKNNYELNLTFGILYGKIGNLEKAIKFFRKSIELKPDGVYAYENLGEVMLEKDKGLIDKMNKNIGNTKELDKIKAKQIKLYREAIPIYEKIYSLDEQNIEAIKTLYKLYEKTENSSDKFEEIKKAYNTINIYGKNHSEFLKLDDILKI